MSDRAEGGQGATARQRAAAGSASGGTPGRAAVESTDPQREPEGAAGSTFERGAGSASGNGAAPFRHDGLFWRRLAHWGSTRAPLWWRDIGPSIVGTIVFGLLRENRRNVIANLRQCCGSRGPVADAAEALRVFREFAYCVSEAYEFASPHGRPVEIESPISLDPRGLLGEGNGVVVLTSHFGTWEIGARVMQKYTSRVNVVMAREANASVEPYQRELRADSGLRVIHSDSSVFSSLNMIHALRRGEIVALQLDRGAPGQVTRRIDFFGKPAEFQYGPFALARLAGVPIWPVLVARTGPRRYRFLPEPLRTVRRHASEAETLAVMEDVVRSFERTIREYPRQWFQFRPFWD